MTDEDVPFVAEEEGSADPASPPPTDSTDSPPELPAAPPGFFARTWPLFAACVLVAATLLAVYELLHPRGGVAAQEPDGAPAFVTVEGTVVRREPAAAAEEVGTLKAGARVAALAATGPWIEVVEDSGVRGFVPADTLEKSADREARERRQKTLLAFTPVYGVVGEATDVTLAPYPLAARAGRLAKGTVIAIHSVDHSYFAFRDKTWGIAFVASAAVDLIPPDPRQPAIEPEKVKPLKNLTIIDLEGEPPPLTSDETLEAEGDAPSVGRSPESEEPAARSASAPPPAPGLVEGAVVAKRVDPVYPDLARRAGIEGVVELEVSIDAAGDVTEVEVVRGLPLGLSEAAADAVHKWKYRPARAASGPVASRKSVRIRFALATD